MKYLALTLALATAIPALGQTQPTASDRREAKIYEAIGDMIARRDELKRKFAVVMHGESVGTIAGHKNPFITPVVWVTMADQSRSFNLVGAYSVVIRRGVPLESGTVYLVRGDDHKVIRHNVVLGIYEIKPPEMSVRRFLDSTGSDFVGGSNPYDGWLVPEHFGNNQSSRVIEKYVLGQYELVSTKPAIGGIMASLWKWETPWGTTYDIDIDFSTACEMMPVRVRARCTKGRRLFALNIDWRKHGKHLLPYRIRYAFDDKPPLPAQSEETIFRYHWLVGDEVPRELFAAENHLAALLDHFNITRSQRVGDEVVAVEHELPVDLYEDQKHNP